MSNIAAPSRTSNGLTSSDLHGTGPVSVAQAAGMLLALGY